MFGRIRDAIYSFVAAVLSSVGLGAISTQLWSWTVKDELGNAKMDIVDLFHVPPNKMQLATYVYDNVALDFQPGTDSNYSNLGYVLLGMVIEKATGHPYVDFLTNILLPRFGISDVFVGATRLAGRRSNEVVYEDPFVGPDATLDPFSPRLAPLPYGGFGGMTDAFIFNQKDKGSKMDIISVESAKLKAFQASLEALISSDF